MIDSKIEKKLIMLETLIDAVRNGSVRLDTLRIAVNSDHNNGKGPITMKVIACATQQKTSITDLV